MLELLELLDSDDCTTLEQAIDIVIKKLKQHTDRSGVVPAGFLSNELGCVLAELGGEAERLGSCGADYADHSQSS
jgi:hypothetical protein